MFNFNNRMGYADGGMAYAGQESPEEEMMELEKVHMTPEELQNLMQIQGEEEMTDDGFPMLAKLGEMLADPEIRAYIEDMIEQQKQSEMQQSEMDQQSSGMGGFGPLQSQGMGGGMGGGGEAQRMGFAGGGGVDGRLLGDSHEVYVPRHVLQLFDHAIGGPSINPHTGNKQYFLGSLLGSIGKAAMSGIGSLGRSIGSSLGSGGFLSSMMPAVKNIASTGISSLARSAASNPSNFFTKEGFSQAGRSALGDMGGAALGAASQAAGNMGGPMGNIARAGLAGLQGAMQPGMGMNMNSARQLGSGAMLGALGEGARMASGALPGMSEMFQRAAPGMASNFAGNVAQRFGASPDMARNIGGFAGEMAGRGAQALSNRYMPQIQGQLANIYGR